MLVTVARFTEPWEAHLFRGRLAAEGLFAVVAHEHHVWNNWPYALALGGVKVQVPLSQRNAAIAVETRCRSGDYRAELEAEFGPLDDLQCPRCGAARFSRRRSLNSLFLLLVSYFCVTVIFPTRASAHRCRSCGTQWDDSLSAQKRLLNAIVAGLLLVATYAWLG